MIKTLQLIGVILVLSCCEDPGEDCCAGPIEVVLGESFAITEGNTIHVENSIIELTFTQLLSDSLCPSDVECITQGTLSISINVNGTDSALSIGDTASPMTEFKNYTIELQRLVYPTKQAEKDNSSSTYAVQMVITRS